MKITRLAKTVEEVLRIAEAGAYLTPGGTVCLPCTPSQLRQVISYSPEQVRSLSPEGFPRKKGAMAVSVAPLGSLEAARALHEKYPDAETGVLVLNFANPTRPGGGKFRDNPGTQEEVLCHYTTLLSSLTSDEADIFFITNKQANTPAQTDALLISPHVAVVRDTLDALTEKPFPIAVLTVSAPIAKRLTPAEQTSLEEVVLNRIRGMLRAAMAEGYRHLVLGAWGCGSFGNDPKKVAQAFRQALTEPFGPDGAYTAADFFEEVVFGIPGSDAPGSNRAVFAACFPEKPL